MCLSEIKISIERKGGEMKEYPAITFEIVHQREDGELERIVLRRSK